RILARTRANFLGAGNTPTSDLRGPRQLSDLGTFMKIGSYACPRGSAWLGASRPVPARGGAGAPLRCDADPALGQTASAGAARLLRQPRPAHLPVRGAARSKSRARETRAADRSVYSVYRVLARCLKDVAILQ